MSKKRTYELDGLGRAGRKGGLRKLVGGNILAAQAAFSFLLIAMRVFMHNMGILLNRRCVANPSIIRPFN